MIDEATRKRRQRQRYAEIGLVSCSVTAPNDAAVLIRRYALVVSALARTGIDCEIEDQLGALVRAGLLRVPLDHPALPESTRRALALLRHSEGLAPAAAPVPTSDVLPASALADWMPPAPSHRLPSRAQAKLALAIAWHLKIELPDEAKTDRKVMSSWISRYQPAWKIAGSPALPDYAPRPHIETEDG